MLKIFAKVQAASQAKRFDFIAPDKDHKLKHYGYMEMRAATTSTAAAITFYGDIVSSAWSCWTDEDKCPQVIQDYINQLDPAEPLDVFFNSGGGDVWAGIAIYNILTRHEGKKTGYVDGLAASIASVILMACDEIKIATGAQVMIHKPWSWASGNADDLRALADKLDGAEDSILDIYMAHAADGKTREDFQDAMRAETWLTVNTAPGYFKISTEEDSASAPAASAAYGRYKNAPAGLPTEQEPEKPPQDGLEAATEPKANEGEETPTPKNTPVNGAESRRKEAEAIAADLWKYGT